MGVIYDEHNMKIVESRKNGQTYLEYFENGVFCSAIYPNTPLKLSIGLTATVMGFVNESREILVLGTGLGTMETQLKVMIPECHITTVDINKWVTELAQKYFGLGQYPNIEYVTADASQYIAHTKRKFDLILVDVYIGDIIPSNLGEQLFYTNLYNHLHTGGMVILNTNMQDYIQLNLTIKRINPLSIIKRNLFSSGFRSIYGNFIHDGGYLYAFHDAIEFSVLKNKIKEKYIAAFDCHVRLSLGVHMLYLRQLQQDVWDCDENESRLISSDMITHYRSYVFHIITQICRTPNDALDIEEQDIEDALRRLAVMYMKINLSDKHASEEKMKGIYRCYNPAYLADLRRIENRLMHHRFSEFSSLILLPDFQMNYDKDMPGLAKALFALSGYVSNVFLDIDDVLQKMIEKEMVI